MHQKVGINFFNPKRFVSNSDSHWISDKACLRVSGVVENASEKLIELKFGVFGSIGDVKILRSQNIGQ